VKQAINECQIRDRWQNLALTLFPLKTGGQGRRQSGKESRKAPLTRAGGFFRGSGCGGDKVLKKKEHSLRGIKS